jgi:acetyl-CoA carboxylase beta subunit
LRDTRDALIADAARVSRRMLDAPSSSRRAVQQGNDRLRDRAVERLRETRGSQSAIVAVVGALVVVRVVIFALEQAFLAAGDAAGVRVVDALTGVVATVVDVVVLFLVLLLFEAIRRIDRESERIQTFMDNVYRRGL